MEVFPSTALQLIGSGSIALVVLQLPRTFARNFGLSAELMGFDYVQLKPMGAVSSNDQFELCYVNMLKLTVPVCTSMILRLFLNCFGIFVGSYSSYSR